MTKPLTITNQIMLKLVDRMKNIVNGLSIRTPTTNTILTEVFTITGSFSIEGPVNIVGTVLADQIVRFVYGTNSTDHDFNVDSTFILFDTGYSLDVSDLSKLVEGDIYYLDCNDCYKSLSDVRTWMSASSGASHPFLVVYPGKKRQNNNLTGNRRVVEFLYTLHLEDDFGSVDSDDVAVTLFEIVGDIEDEIQRDARFLLEDACQAIDSEITEADAYISDANDNIAGIFMTLSIKYRTDLKDSRKLKP